MIESDATTYRIPSGATEIARVEQYSGEWAIYEPAGRSFLSNIESIDLAAHLRAQETIGEACDGAACYSVIDGVAVLEARGMITKYGSSFSLFPGTVRVKSAIRKARTDPSVGAMLLVIDSPGGTVRGTRDLADEIAAFAAEKPLTAYAEDLCASAAYWLAAGAGRVVANAAAMVGSIGTYLVVSDLSAKAEAEGIKVHVVRSGEHKGSFTPGTEITEEQLAEAQRLLDSMNEQFVAAVAAGRGMSAQQVAAIADGRVHPASEAVSLGLVDAIETKEKALDDLRELAASSLENNETPNRRNLAMSTDTKPNAAAPTTPATPPAPAPEPAEPASATLAELKSALPNATAEQRESYLERGLTLSAAQGEYIADMEAKAAAGGVEPIGASGPNADAGETARETWVRLVDAEAKSNGGDRSKATSVVNRKNPGLRESMLAEVNTDAA